MKERFAAIFKTKTRDEWAAIFDGTDACVAPVLSPWEAHEHPHNVARSTYIEVDGAVQPAPAPRFSKTPSAVSKPPSPPGADTVSGLVGVGRRRERGRQAPRVGRAQLRVRAREEGPFRSPPPIAALSEEITSRGSSLRHR